MRICAIALSRSADAPRPGEPEGPMPRMTIFAESMIDLSRQLVASPH